ncbi:MAG: polysaccharide deacetylase family protein [Acidobacteriaceae bacterium]
MAAVAAAIVSYASVSPTSQMWGRTVAHVPPGEIALTYDDGPNDGTTERLLDVLAKANARATFFLIGRYVRRQPGLVRRIHQAGHVLGNHTDTHPNLVFASSMRVRAEMGRCQHSIEDATGEAVQFFRPPFGMRRADTLSIARSLQLTPVMWNVTCYDWKATSAQAVLHHADRQMRRNDARGRGSILLLHDGGHIAPGAERRHTIEATRVLLSRNEARRLVTIGE